MRIARAPPSRGGVASRSASPLLLWALALAAFLLALAAPIVGVKASATAAMRIVSADDIASNPILYGNIEASRTHGLLERIDATGSFTSVQRELHNPWSLIKGATMERPANYSLLAMTSTIEGQQQNLAFVQDVDPTLIFRKCEPGYSPFFKSYAWGGSSKYVLPMTRVKGHDQRVAFEGVIKVGGQSIPVGIDTGKGISWVVSTAVKHKATRMLKKFNPTRAVGSTKAKVLGMPVQIRLSEGSRQPDSYNDIAAGLQRVDAMANFLPPPPSTPYKSPSGGGGDKTPLIATANSPTQSMLSWAGMSKRARKFIPSGMMPRITGRLKADFLSKHKSGPNWFMKLLIFAFKVLKAVFKEYADGGALSGGDDAKDGDAAAEGGEGQSEGSGEGQASQEEQAPAAEEGFFTQLSSLITTRTQSQAATKTSASGTASATSTAAAAARVRASLASMFAAAEASDAASETDAAAVHALSALLGADELAGDLAFVRLLAQNDWVTADSVKQFLALNGQHKAATAAAAAAAASAAAAEGVYSFISTADEARAAVAAQTAAASSLIDTSSGAGADSAAAAAALLSTTVLVPSRAWAAMSDDELTALLALGSETTIEEDESLAAELEEAEAAEAVETEIASLLEAGATAGVGLSAARATERVTALRKYPAPPPLPFTSQQLEVSLAPPVHVLQALVDRVTAAAAAAAHDPVARDRLLHAAAASLARKHGRHVPAVTAEHLRALAASAQSGRVRTLVDDFFAHAQHQLAQARDHRARLAVRARLARRFADAYGVGSLDDYMAGRLQADELGLLRKPDAAREDHIDWETCPSTDSDGADHSGGASTASTTSPSAAGAEEGGGMMTASFAAPAVAALSSAAFPRWVSPFAAKCPHLNATERYNTRLSEAVYWAEPTEPMLRRAVYGLDHLRMPDDINAAMRAAGAKADRFAALVASADFAAALANRAEDEQGLETDPRSYRVINRGGSVRKPKSAAGGSNSKIKRSVNPGDIRARMHSLVEQQAETAAAAGSATAATAEAATAEAAAAAGAAASALYQGLTREQALDLLWEQWAADAATLPAGEQEKLFIELGSSLARATAAAVKSDDTSAITGNIYGDEDYDTISAVERERRAAVRESLARAYAAASGVPLRAARLAMAAASAAQSDNTATSGAALDEAISAAAAALNADGKASSASATGAAAAAVLARAAAESAASAAAAERAVMSGAGVLDWERVYGPELLATMIGADELAQLRADALATASALTPDESDSADDSSDDSTVFAELGAGVSAGKKKGGKKAAKVTIEDMGAVSYEGEWDVLGTGYAKHKFAVVVKVNEAYPTLTSLSGLLGLGYSGDMTVTRGLTQPFLSNAYTLERHPGTGAPPCMGMPCVMDPAAMCCEEQRPAIFSFYVHRFFQGACFSMHQPDMGWAGGPMMWAPAVHSYSSWMVRVDDVLIGGVALGTGPMHAAVHTNYENVAAPMDSGAFWSMNFEARVPVDPSCKDVQKLPDVTFLVNGHRLTMTWVDYVRVLDGGDGSLVCHSRFVSGPWGAFPAPTWIFGYPFLAKFFTVFNAVSGQIGFAPAVHIKYEVQGCKPGAGGALDTVMSGCIKNGPGGAPGAAPGNGGRGGGRGGGGGGAAIPRLRAGERVMPDGRVRDGKGKVIGRIDYSTGAVRGRDGRVVRPPIELKSQGSTQGAVVKPQTEKKDAAQPTPPPQTPLPEQLQPELAEPVPETAAEAEARAAEEAQAVTDFSDADADNAGSEGNSTAGDSTESLGARVRSGLSQLHGTDKGHIVSEREPWEDAWRRVLRKVGQLEVELDYYNQVLVARLRQEGKESVASLFERQLQRLAETLLVVKTWAEGHARTPAHTALLRRAEQQGREDERVCMTTMNPAYGRTCRDLLRLARRLQTVTAAVDVQMGRIPVYPDQDKQAGLDGAAGRDARSPAWARQRVEEGRKLAWAVVSDAEAEAAAVRRANDILQRGGYVNTLAPASEADQMSAEESGAAKDAGPSSSGSKVNEREWYSKLTGDQKADSSVIEGMFKPRQVPEFISKAGLNAAAGTTPTQSIKELMRPRSSRVAYLERRGIFGLGNDMTGAESTRAYGRIYNADLVAAQGASLLEVGAGARQRVRGDLAQRRARGPPGADWPEAEAVMDEAPVDWNRVSDAWQQSQNPFHRTMNKWRNRVHSEWIHTP